MIAISRALSAPLTASLALVAAPLPAETVRCVMSDGTDVSFDIDRTQFAPPFDRKEPPRQQRTRVTHDEAIFTATPFLLGQARGFEAIAADGQTTVFVVQPNGAARWSRPGTALTGSCRIETGKN
ncbi:MAG: hypothetical protein AAFQ64_05270 [Pseudomonadota bacterium]